jgi:hypothetical protein
MESLGSVPLDRDSPGSVRFKIDGPVVLYAVWDRLVPAPSLRFKEQPTFYIYFDRQDLKVRLHHF